MNEVLLLFLKVLGCALLIAPVIYATVCRIMDYRDRKRAEVVNVVIKGLTDILDVMIKSMEGKKNDVEGKQNSGNPDQ